MSQRLLYLQETLHNLSLSDPIMEQQGAMQYLTNVSEKKTNNHPSLYVSSSLLAPFSRLHTHTHTLINAIKLNRVYTKSLIVITVKNV